MSSGRKREAEEIVQLKRAAAVGQLLLGQLDKRLPEITMEQFVDLPRAKIKAERERLKRHLANELTKFCEKNFENLRPEDLASLYEQLYSQNSEWFVPLMDFTKKFGAIKQSVLNDAPLHSTIHISPWGLQFQYPEQLLIKDMAEMYNLARSYETEIAEFKYKTWQEVKNNETRAKVARLTRRRDACLRACLLGAFNLIEAYINGLAWQYVQTHDLSKLSKDNRNTLTEEDRLVSIVDKLIKVPRLIAERPTAPLHQSREPLKTFVEIVKPYRDAIVHASPFTTAVKYGGYDKLAKLYNLSIETVSIAVDKTLDLIRTVHQFVTNDVSLPNWVLPRDEDGNFVINISPVRIT